MRACQWSLVLIPGILLTSCNAEEAPQPTVEELSARLHLQGGGTLGYPIWNNTILDNEPAASVLKAGHGRQGEVISALAKKLRDNTNCENCIHEGRSGNKRTYTVGEIACFILVEIHTEETLELVVDEMKRRRSAGEPITGICWALRYYHVGPTYEEKLRKRLSAEKTDAGKGF